MLESTGRNPRIDSCRATCISRRCSEGLMMQEVSTEVKSSKERYRAWLKEHNPRQYKKTLEMDQYTAYLASQPIDPEVLAFFEQPEHKAWHDAAWAEVGRVRSP